MRNKYFHFNNLTKTAFQLAFLFCLQFSFGQEWTNYSTGTTSKTLANSYVNKIIVENDGNKWFGTEGGVSKFDGTSWISYTTEDGLINNHVTSIAVDKDNNLWFGTEGGISKFDGENWTSYTETDGLVNNRVNTLIIDKNDNLWIGTNGGVSRFDGSNWTPYLFTGFFANHIFSIVVDQNSDLWFGTGEGVYKLESNSLFLFNDLNHNSVSSIVVDENNTFWFGTDDEGVFKFDGKSWASFNTSHGLISNYVTSLAIDKNNNVLLGTPMGVSKYNGTNWISHSTNDGLINNYVTSIAVDKDDNIWYGTFGGVSKFDGVNWTSFEIEEGLISNDVRSVALDKNNHLWVGTFEGVSKFDGKNWTSFTSANGLVNNKIFTIAIDKNNNVWFGTTNGVSKFDGKNWTSYTQTDGLIDNTVYSIGVDKNNHLWFGTNKGISKFDGTEWMTYTKKDGLIDNWVKSITFDNDDNIWFGTWGGVSKFDGTNWTSYIPDGNMNPFYCTIVIDKNDNLWYGTESGILKFDGSNWKSYSIDNEHNYIISVAIDKNNNPWFGTNNGVSKFDGTNWTTYSTLNGLAHNVVTSVVIDQEGNKWFGTSNGISKFSDGGTGPVNNIDTLTTVIIFNDENENGKKDSTEKGISGQLVQIDSTFSFSQDNGFVYRELTDGAHTISFKAPENWKLTTESTFTINIPNDTDTLYFGIKAIENRPDLKVNVTSNRTRANFSVNSWVNYKNVGSVTESGTVEVLLDSLVKFESSVPTFTSKDGQKLRFDFTDLGVNESKQIRITAKMPNVEFLGDTLTTLVSISPIVSDVDSLNNRDSLRSVLTGSYDPNDKAVQQGVLDENYVLFGEKLNYTIRFQNTGNDTAFNVNVTDTISFNMDMSSFELIGSSHPCQLEVKGTNTMVFHFYDILLPDSTTNELGSHGYVQYSLKPKKGLTENTKVNNTGYIYFDYNPAIVTNTTLNTYVSKIPKTTSTEGISTISSNNLFTLYPNPTESNFTVDLGKETRTVTIKITDIQGRLVKQESKENTRFVHLNLTENKGIFFVTVSTEKGEETLKVVSRH